MTDYDRDMWTYYYGLAMHALIRQDDLGGVSSQMVAHEAALLADAMLDEIQSREEAAKDRAKAS